MDGRGPFRLLVRKDFIPLPSDMADVLVLVDVFVAVS